ncbi:LacI family DNA-binding transcriptional regulator [Oerskovia sp. M15]
MPNPPARPTLIDVARAAEVSRATASRVLSGVTTVNSDLARRVVDAAAKLDYRTNSAARALRADRPVPSPSWHPPASWTTGWDRS